MTQNFLKAIQSTPITIGSESIQVESKRVTLPFPNGGFVFQTPTAVYNLKTSQRLPIWDVTRISLLIVWGVGALVLLRLWGLKNRKYLTAQSS